jgi:hypothetical protein
MPKAGFIVARVCFLVLAASMLGAGMLATPAAGAKPICASSAGKCFAVTVLQTKPPAGGTVAFTFTVTNEAPTQQIGSFQITAPANFVITGASTPSFTSGSALFVNLSVAPGALITVTVNAVLPCSGSSYQWGIEVKQSNDFSGTGNDFQPDPASAGNLQGTLAGTCSLAFTNDGQPAGTAASTPASPAVITAGFGSSGGPVKVAVFDGSGQPITNQAAIGSVVITVALGAKPGSGTLSGTTTGNTSAGVASFSDLKISQQGIGYTLTATTKSPGFNSNPAPSAAFTIFGSLQKCNSPKSCQVSSSLSSSTTTGTVTTSSPPGDSLGTGIGGVSANELYGCVTYQPVSDPFSFNVYNPSGVADRDALFSASLVIKKSLVQSTPGRSTASAWQICYASSEPFKAVDGTSGSVTIGGVLYFTGELPDCSATQLAPCVQDRTKSSGNVVITLLAVGDPFYRG